MREDNQALTVEQFTEIINQIKQNFSFSKYKHEIGIKYIHPSFDMRDGKCFNIKFRAGHIDKTFDSRVCEYDNMYQDIQVWLQMHHLEYRHIL